VRVTTVRVPTTDVRALRRRLGLSQSEFAARFGFQAATLKNWNKAERGPMAGAVLLAVIARHPRLLKTLSKRQGEKLVGRGDLNARPPAPRQVRYQAALRPDILLI